MHSQHKNLIEKIKEVLPKEKETFEEIRYEDEIDNMKAKSYNQALQDVISSLPQVMEVIKGEIEEITGEMRTSETDRIIKLLTLE